MALPRLHGRSTARRAHRPPARPAPETRCARYSALRVQVGRFRSAGGRIAARASPASGVKLAASAPRSPSRETPTAPRRSPRRARPVRVFATNTPTSAKRDAGFGNLRTPRGHGNSTAVMISSAASAVSYMPLKKSSAAIVRLLVRTVASSAEHRRRIVGGGIVVGERAADRAAVAHLPVADAPASAASAGIACFTACGRGDLGVRVSAPMTSRVAVLRDALQLGDARQVDQCAGLGEPQLHRADQALPAREQPAAGRRPATAAASATRLRLMIRWRTCVGLLGCWRAASRIARHTRCGVRRHVDV